MGIPSLPKGLNLIALRSCFKMRSKDESTINNMSSCQHIKDLVYTWLKDDFKLGSGFSFTAKIRINGTVTT